MVARTVARLHTPPQKGYGFRSSFSHRTFQYDCKIQTGCAQLTVVRIVKVIKDVDAATENLTSVDNAQFTVQASPLFGPQQAQARPAARQRRIDLPMQAGCCELRPPFGLQLGCADAVYQHLHRHTAAGCTDQGLSHLSARAVEIKNICFQLNPILGTVHRRNQCGKVLSTTLQQQGRARSDQ